MLLAEPGGDQQPVLPDGAGLGAAAAGVPGHGRHGDRLAGADLGRLLGHQAGDAAGHPAAHADPAHLRARHRPDLRALRQLGPVRLHRAGGGDVQVIVESGVGLRHRRHAGHDHHHRDDLLRHPLRLEIPAAAVPGGDRLLLRRRLRVLRVEPVEVAGRWLVSDRHRHRHVRADDHLDARAAPAQPTSCAKTPSRCATSSMPCSSARPRASRVPRCF